MVLVVVSVTKKNVIGSLIVKMGDSISYEGVRCLQIYAAHSYRCTSSRLRVVLTITLVFSNETSQTMLVVDVSSSLSLDVKYRSPFCVYLRHT